MHTTGKGWIMPENGHRCLTGAILAAWIANPLGSLLNPAKGKCLEVPSAPLAYSTLNIFPRSTTIALELKINLKTIRVLMS
jgi:hypothetical protein